MPVHCRTSCTTIESFACHNHSLAKTLKNVDVDSCGLYENTILEIAETILQKVNEGFAQLFDNPGLFAETFAKGFNQFVFLDCLDEF